MYFDQMYMIYRLSHKFVKYDIIYPQSLVKQGSKQRRIFMNLTNGIKRNHLDVCNDT